MLKWSISRLEYEGIEGRWLDTANFPGVFCPVGTPMSNSEIFAVDEALLLCPCNVFGELLFTGPFLASGYFGDKELTNAKFLELPCGAHGTTSAERNELPSQMPSSSSNSSEITSKKNASSKSSTSKNTVRCYRSGDLGRLTDSRGKFYCKDPAGFGEQELVFEIAGRVDRQIKINGQRLELGEVEAAILRFQVLRYTT